MHSSEPAPLIVRWTLGLEDATALDRPVRTLEPLVGKAFGTDPRGSALRGEWLGHAIHPVLTDLVIDTWTSATVLDLVGGRDSDSAAQRLIGAGLLTAAPTAWTGWAEGSAAGVREQRVGLVTRSPTPPRSASTRRRGSHAGGAVEARAWGWRSPVRPCRESAPTWAVTSSAPARWRATIRRTTTGRRTDRRRPPTSETLTGDRSTLSTTATSPASTAARSTTIPGPAGRQADERGHGGPDGLDRSGPTVDLIDVDPGARGTCRSCRSSSTPPRGPVHRANAGPSRPPAGVDRHRRRRTARACPGRGRVRIHRCDCAGSPARARGRTPSGRPPWRPEASPGVAWGGPSGRSDDQAAGRRRPGVGERGGQGSPRRYVGVRCRRAERGRMRAATGGVRRGRGAGRAGRAVPPGPSPRRGGGRRVVLVRDRGAAEPGRPVGVEVAGDAHLVARRHRTRAAREAGGHPTPRRGRPPGVGPVDDQLGHGEVHDPAGADGQGGAELAGPEARPGRCPG